MTFKPKKGAQTMGTIGNYQKKIDQKRGLYRFKCKLLILEKGYNFVCIWSTRTQ